MHFSIHPEACIASGPEAALLQAALAAAPHSSFAITAAGLTTAPPTAPPSFETLTGGTTGAPKHIRRSQQSWIESFEINRAAWSLGPGTRIATLGALTHSLSLYGALETLHCGAALHLLAPLRPDRQAAALASNGITLLWATPSQVRLLRGAPVPSLTRLLIGGGALDNTTRAHARTLFPNAEIIVFYGASETSFITLSHAHSPPGSVGQPYPGVALEIRETNSTGTGNIWARSPYLFEDYAAATGSAKRDSAGFVCVGERGFLDAAGNLHITGRADRSVQIADQTVQLEAVETALFALPGVLEAAVIPVPDPLRGIALHAAIALAPDVPAPGLAAAGLSPLATPRHLTVIAPADWPRRPSGKTDLAALADRFAGRPA